MNKKPKIPELAKESPHQVLEDTGTAFDPSTQHIDLTKEEKRRTTALLLAIQAYDSIIIKDAEMYLAVSREHDRNPDALRIQPATMNAMVSAALQFDSFISGELQTAIKARKAAEFTEATGEQGTESAKAEGHEGKSVEQR